MSDDLVKRAREALNGVKEGPWWTDGKYRGDEMGCPIIAARTDCGPLPGNPTRGMVAWASAVLNTEARKCEANAKFIAASRDLVPAMADRIEEYERAFANLHREYDARGDRIEELEAKLAKAAGLLEAWVQVAAHCTIEEGVCCCGDNMDAHAGPMNCGHSPVDHGAYVAMNLAEETNATLAELKGQDDD